MHKIMGKNLSLEKDLQDIFAHDANCAEDPDKDKQTTGAWFGFTWITGTYM